MSISSSITPLTFTGVSTFSNDFQTILSREVAIASLPVKQAQNDQQTLTDKKSALTGLWSAVSGMASSLSALGQLGSGQALAVSTNSSNVNVSLASGAVAGTYQITDITSLAAAAIATGAQGYASESATAVTGGSGQVQLVVGSTKKTLPIGAAQDNLDGIRDAINSAGLGVAASVIDTGRTDGQRYFLTLTANAPGAQDILLRTTPDDAGTNLLSQIDPGSNAVFSVNGQQVTRSDNYISGVIPGVNLQLVNETQTGDRITVTVSQSRAPVTSALQSFVSAYNTLTQKLDAQKGQNAGLLMGDSMIVDLGSRLREAANHQGSGAISSLTDLGITIGNDGAMSLDSSVVNAMQSSDLNNVFQFLGSSTQGLASLADAFSEYSDPVSGLIQTRLTGYDNTDKSLSDQIQTMTDRVNAMQTTLMSQLQAADALVSQLQSQQSMLTASIDSLNMVTYGKQNGNQ